MQLWPGTFGFCIHFDGTESELSTEARSQVQSKASPVPLSLCGPRGKWWPRRQRGQTKVPTRPRHRVGVHQLTLQEPSGLLEEGQAGHIQEKGLGTAERITRTRSILVWHFQDLGGMGTLIPSCIYLLSFLMHHPARSNVTIYLTTRMPPQVWSNNGMGNKNMQEKPRTSLLLERIH